MASIQNYLIDSIKQNNDMYKNNINATHPYPCGICKKKVNKNQEGIFCSNCNYWIHIKCNSTSLMDYNQMIEDNLTLSDKEKDNCEWLCNKCQIIKTAQIFPFGLENNQELLNITHSDLMKALENLPSYEITSQAANFDALKPSNIDENIINNLNSRYYAAREFQSLANENSFNIFHSNMDGLENKFDLLHNFVNNTKLDLDIICLSETGQKLNYDFDTNITLVWYKQPFSTGSKFNKGGVAIYTRDNINVFEREDLKKIDDCFEAIWVEIENDKTQNIICGCIYRHPNSDIEIFDNYIDKCLKIDKEKNNATYLVTLI